MDSKQLFKLYNSKISSSNWFDEKDQLAQNDDKIKWFNCGVGKDYKSEIVNQSLNSFFPEDDVYLCISSNNSFLVQKSIVAEEIGKILHKKELAIINKSFTKIIEFNSIGIFKKGIIRDFPKERERPSGVPLKVSFTANMTDSDYASKIATLINKHISSLENELHKDYGGCMEHLWIDFQLIESHKTYPFRFQKRVTIPASFTELYSYNVGNYTVKPDFVKLQMLSSEEEICSYAFELLHKSTKILENKQKQLADFNVNAFRSDFLSACKKLGYII
ncbi:hypothetical protein [Flavobacterium johnsoniae]|uniref:hypothetical protein n=1 Tax=Flavobacterium johnsoniae TaxID=986 RepID=UPI0011EC98A3|nr:hypothetical protein [Flavobacterium johnsoniae]